MDGQSWKRKLLPQWYQDNWVGRRFGVEIAESLKDASTESNLQDVVVAHQSSTEANRAGKSIFKFLSQNIPHGAYILTTCNGLVKSINQAFPSKVTNSFKN